MKPAAAVRTLVFGLVVGCLAAPRPASAQAECPRASGPDAEAGWTAYGDNEMEAARASFEAALARCGDDHYARTGLAYVELREGNVVGARALWSEVVEAQPTNVDALTGLGLAAWRLGDLEAVEDSFERVVALVPDHPTALEYLDRLAGQAEAAARPPDPAEEAWRSGDTNLAYALYLGRLDVDPTDPVAALRVALVTAWQGDYGEAIRRLDALIEQDPRHVDARLARARVRAWSGDLERAQSEVLDVLAVRPDHPEALEALALFQAWSGDAEAALSSYDDLVSIAPQSAAVGRQRAQALAWSARFEASRAAYDSLLARDPDDREARLGLARTLAFGQDFEGAIAEYDRVLSSEPGEVRALVGKARTLGWAGRLVESETVAVQAVEADRNSAEAWAGLGQVYAWEGRSAAAKDALEAAARLAPTNAEIQNQLRAVDLMLAPVARTRVAVEDDSDGNLMVSTTLSASVHPVPRLDVRVDGYFRNLEQRIQLGALERAARGATLTAAYELSPGWLVSAGAGGSTSDGLGSPSYFAYRGGVRSPERYPIVGSFELTSRGLDETAALAHLGVRSTEGLLTARWMSASGWRVDGSAGFGVYEGTESNGRRSASLAVSRRIGRLFGVGLSARGFSFEKDLVDGYFDPDFYGLVELTSYWLYRTGDWTLLAEAAPGMQQVTTDGDPGTSLRANARVAYRLGPGREVSLSGGYSSAGLVSFATGDASYDYKALILGVGWTF